MLLSLHPDIRIQKLRIGAENAPLMVIDNAVTEVDQLVSRASSMEFGTTPELFPGVRAQAPHSYRSIFEGELKGSIVEFFEKSNTTFQFSLMHYSLVTTRAQNLRLLQRIPHFDSLDGDGLASIHYLFKSDYGGTAFYRHRKTGFEYIDGSRKDRYFQSLEQESGGPNVPRAEYINGHTSLFEQIAVQEGVYNRLLIYRRNSLHSPCIGKDSLLHPDPLRGRLSINCFFN